MRIKNFRAISYLTGILTFSVVVTGLHFTTQEAGLWVCPPSADTLKNPFRNDTTAYKEGKKIYESSCWSCHGKSGRGDGPAAKALNKKPADHTSSFVQQQSDGSIYWKISKGKGQMSPYEKSFSKAQRWKLVNYIRMLGKTGGTK